MKVINIVGARPQFIKYSPIAKALKNANIQNILIHTGQHYDYKMSGIFADEFAIGEPDYFLGVGSGAHGEQTAKVIHKVEEVLVKERPDVVILYGDTNSTLGGAIATSKLHIPVAHVEAGLRSFNKYMPEEINRILTDHVSSLLLCPTKEAVTNLTNEGFKNIMHRGELIAENTDFSVKAEVNNPLVINVGDVMYDVILEVVKIAQEKSKILQDLSLTTKDYYVLTIHRAENTDDKQKFAEIVEFINTFSAGKTVIYPMHPRTKKVYENATVNFHDKIKIIEPLGYFDMVHLLNNAEKAMTDSGGMQKEAFWLRVPTVTLREETEWVETVECGWNVLYRNFQGKHGLQDNPAQYYGDGRAANRIIDVISKTIAL